MTMKLVKLNISKNSVLLNKSKLKGCSFHDQLQLALKKCQRLIAMHEDIELTLSFESVNMRDRNAIVAQAELDDIWQSFVYVPAPKVPKVTVAMQKHHIQSVRLVRLCADKTVNKLQEGKNM